MRSLGLALLSLALLASPALGGEEKTAAQALAELEKVVQDQASTWETRYAAYNEAKEAIAAIDKKADPQGRADAEAAYQAIRPQVAEALRRDGVPVGGWIMGIFSTLLLWGGFAFCLRKAMSKTPDVELDEDETWPIRPEGQ